MSVKDLYITDSLQKLDVMAQKDEVFNNIKKSRKCRNFTVLTKRFMAELSQCQDDHEKCYILCLRYIRLMDYIFETSDDTNYSQSLYSSDYRKVKQIADGLKINLEKRYKELVKENTTSPAHVAINFIPQSCNIEVGDGRVFKDKYITPRDLFNIIEEEKNFLLVDIRPQSEFESCKINAKQGTIINISAKSIEPGLSANTLGKRLDKSLMEVWEKRDKFDIIIFMDHDTQKHNYVGSKIERLRDYIVKWDTLRNYKQEPVVLNGGLREFVEWYPASVDNSQLFLSQTNSEIDELLDIDSITYPESGSTKQVNLKLNAINSITNLENRVKRDFEDEDGSHNFQSLSEGNLPLDFYNSKESIPISPYKYLSEESLRKDLVTPEPEILFPPVVEGEQIQKPKQDVEAAEIKEILEGDKAALLREVRKTAKPKFSQEESQEIGDRRREQSENRSPREKEPRLRDTREPSYQDKSQIIKPPPPTIDRSHKPLALPGEGYTGLRNIKNICYMNGLLQCLKVIPILKSIYVTSDKYITFTTRTPPKMNFHFAQVLRELWGGIQQKPKTFLIQEFKDRVCEFAPMYDRNTHEDCFEFFMFLFNAISEDCSVDLQRPRMMTESQKAWYGHLQGRSSVWVDNFYYQLKNTKFCCNCRKVNLSFETDSTLMLPVATKTSYLKDIVAEYLRENRLTDFSCSNCKSTGTIINKKDLVVEPEVLVIVLKRYIANADGTFRKNEAEVEFPLYDLQFGNSRYNLYGVVQHSGGMTFGHYFASVLLNDKKGTWALFNDETISLYSSPVNEMSQIKSAAAGFFYVRNSK